MSKILISILCVFSLPALAKTGIRITPDSPVVITADYTAPDGTVIKAPWFKFNARVINASSQHLTIAAIEVTSRAPDGREVKNTMVPSDYNYTLECGAGVTTPITFETFGELLPYESAPLQLMYVGGPLPSECVTQHINIPNPSVWSSNNPETHGAHVYKVKAKFIGWWGPPNHPIKRFEKTVQFQTQ